MYLKSIQAGHLPIRIEEIEITGLQLVFMCETNALLRMFFKRCFVYILLFSNIGW